MRSVAMTVVLAALASCGSSVPPKMPHLSEEEAAQDRQACQFQAGADVADTLAIGSPTGASLPIEHIVLVMQENRSFDHYFSKLSHDGVDVAAPDATNPDANGQLVSRFHASDYCFSDTNHSWAGTHAEIDGGKMDGFVLQNSMNGDDGSRAMGYYDESDLPFYYDLARTFAISDRHFCSAPGETAPNREFYAAASSRGAVSENVLPPTRDAGGNLVPNIYDLLDRAGVDWQFYSVGATPQWASAVATSPGILSRDQQRFHPLSDFFDAAKAGTLPQVAWVDEAFSDTTGGNEHPSGDMQQGQRFIASVVNAILNSPNWPSAALFVTWDEHGGLYDHVVPPKACVPDDFPVVDKDDNGAPVPVEGTFDSLGIRVPLLAVSPYVKRGHVSHHVTDHTSLLRFVEAKFGLPALTRRDANAEPPFDLFDFAHPDTSIPILATASIDTPALHNCK